jgi:hypothetical protein
MYTILDYRTKKAMKEAVVAGERVATYESGGTQIGHQRSTSTGTVCLQGPHPPRSYVQVERILAGLPRLVTRTWHATVLLDDGLVVKVLR